MSVREPTDRYLSPEQAKRFYDRLGSAQDWQGFYENPAINELAVLVTAKASRSRLGFQYTERFIERLPVWIILDSDGTRLG